MHRIQGALVAIRFPDDGKGRLCLSFSKSGLTKAIINRAYRSPRVSQFLRVAQHGDWFLRKDMSKAFYHVRLNERSRRLTGFRCPLTGRLGRFTAPVFVLRHAPESLYIWATVARHAYQQLALEAATWLRKETGTGELADELERAAASLDAYVDDYVAVGSPRAIMMPESKLPNPPAGKTPCARAIQSD